MSQCGNKYVNSIDAQFTVYSHWRKNLVNHMFDANLRQVLCKVRQLLTLWGNRVTAPLHFSRKLRHLNGIAIDKRRLYRQQQRFETSHTNFIWIMVYIVGTLLCQRYYGSVLPLRIPSRRYTLLIVSVSNSKLKTHLVLEIKILLVLLLTLAFHWHMEYEYSNETFKPRGGSVIGHPISCCAEIRIC